MFLRSFLVSFWANLINYDTINSNYRIIVFCYVSLCYILIIFLLHWNLAFVYFHKICDSPRVLARRKFMLQFRLLEKNCSTLYGRRLIAFNPKKNAKNGCRKCVQICVFLGLVNGALNELVSNYRFK